MCGQSVVDRVSALKPIFVVGAPRSGTTLIGKILGQHSQIYSPGETHFFEDVWARRKELGQLSSESEVARAVDRLMTLFQRYNFPETQAFLESCVDPTDLIQLTLEIGGGYGALYNAFSLLMTDCAGKPRICDDTPKHLFYTVDILRLLPEAKVIGLVRDPRDFLFSYRNYWRRSTESERIKALYHPVMTSMLWRSSVKALRKCALELGPSKVLLVQYESLVANPEPIVQSICTFLGVGFEMALLQVESNNSSFVQSSMGIFSTSIGRWRIGLPAEDVWWCQFLNKDYMRHFGMRTESVDVSPINLLRSVASTPAAFVRAMKVNREKRGPLMGYLVRRLRTL